MDCVSDATNMLMCACCLVMSLIASYALVVFICCIINIIIINKVLIKVTLNKVIAGALYIVICG